MKKLIILVSILVFSFSFFTSASAQERTCYYSFEVFGTDNWEMKNGFDSVIFEYSDDRGWRRYDGKIGLIEMGFNGLRGAGNTFMELDMARSFHMAINAATYSVALNRARTLGVTVGVGMSINDYAFATPTRFEKVDGTILPVETNEKLKKSKLNTFAIHIPIAFEVNPSRHFFFSVGAYADLVMASHVKSKFPKEKIKGANAEFAQFGLTARVGYRDAYFFTNYGLSDLIRSDRGPRVAPYSFGIGLDF